MAEALDHTKDRILPCQLDVADADSVTAMGAWVAETVGRVDILVNNAAFDYDTDQRAITADLDRVRLALETNLFGAWHTTQAPAPAAAPELSSQDRERQQRGRLTRRHERRHPGIQRLQGRSQRPDPAARRGTERRRVLGQRSLPGLDGPARLNIHVPDAGAHLNHNLGALWPSYTAYVNSLLLIGLLWAKTIKPATIGIDGSGSSYTDNCFRS